jgi:hypothetical protein
MYVLYGVDAMSSCGWAVDETFYQYLRSVVSGHAQFSCRIAIAKEQKSSNNHESKMYVPFALSLWGLAEPTHIHIMNHMQFVFHVVEGFFIGASAYGLRDNFTPLFPGSLILMHGPTRWFLGHSFDSIKAKPLEIDAPPPHEGISSDFDTILDHLKPKKPDTIRIDPAQVKDESKMTPDELAEADAKKLKMSGGPKPVLKEDLPSMGVFLRC